MINTNNTTKEKQQLVTTGPTNVEAYKLPETSEILSPEDIEVIEALKPQDVALDWSGYYWPLVKRCQYNYNLFPNYIEFRISGQEAPKYKVPSEYYAKLKQIYLSCGWRKCVIDVPESRNGDTVIRLYMQTEK